MAEERQPLGREDEVKERLIAEHLAGGASPTENRGPQVGVQTAFDENGCVTTITGNSDAPDIGAPDALHSVPDDLGWQTEQSGTRGDSFQKPAMPPIEPEDVWGTPRR